MTGRHPDTGRVRATWSVVVQHCAVDCHGASPQVVSETRNRPSWVPTHYALLFPYSTEGRQGEGYGLLMVTDATRRPGLNIVLCGDRLFQQYVLDTYAKMEQQLLLNYLQFNQNSIRR